jgi:hypothetical protein
VDLSPLRRQQGVGWNHFLHGGSTEDEGNNYGVSNFTDMTIWRLFFPEGDIKAEMMSPPWISLVSSSFCCG